MSRDRSLATETASRDAIIAVLLVVLALGLRWLLYGWFAGREPDFARLLAASDHSPLYREALLAHLGEYLLYNHTEPPLAILRDWAVEAFVGPANTNLASMVVAGISDSLAAGLAFLIARRIGAGLALSILAGLLTSHRFLLLEVTTLGGGWDSINPFLATLYLWLLIDLVQIPGRGRAILAGFAALLLIASHTFGAPVVVATLVVAGAMLSARTGQGRLAALAFVFPALLIGWTVAKNGVQHGVWSMSSGVGQNVLQAYARSFKDPSGQERGVWLMAKREGYPDWWIWCYDEARNRNMHSNLNIPSWYGTCMYRRTGNAVVPDYAGLEAYFAENPNPGMEALVAKDMAIAAERPWLWSGPVSWRATGVSIAYGAVSKNVLADLLLSRPDKFIGRMISTLRQHWFYNGAVSYTLLNRPPYEEPGIVYAINLAIIPLFYLGNFIAIAALFRTLWRLYGKWRGRVKEVCRDAREDARAVLAFAITPVMALSVLLACCENYRHALVFLPVLLALALDALGRREFWAALQGFPGQALSAVRRLQPGRTPTS